MANHISKKLIKNWYEVDIYNNITKFKCKHNNDSDLYIIDIYLWDWNSDWFNIIDWLRNNKNSSAPIIIISWYNDTDKKIYWLDIWADDYLTKPFAPDELIARIRALLRRKSDNDKTSIIRHKKIEFNSKTKEIKLEWKIVHFAKKEIQIIEFFLLNKLELIPKIKLIKSIWWVNDMLDISDNTINATISKVRKKLWDNFNLKTVISWGYILQ